MINNKVNQILARWNPLEVPKGIADIEYLSYVPSIVEMGERETELRAYLVKVVCDDMGLAYDDNNPLHRDDLDRVVSELLQVLRS